MAVVRNNTDDVLSLYSPDAPPVLAGDEITVPDDDFAGRAWPKSVWTLVKKPGKGYVDASPDDSYVFLPADADEPASDEIEESA